MGLCQGRVCGYATRVPGRGRAGRGRPATSQASPAADRPARAARRAPAGDDAGTPATAQYHVHCTHDDTDRSRIDAMTPVPKPWHGDPRRHRAAAARRTSSPSTSTRTPSTCRWLVDNGCDGVVPNGSLGEYQTLTADERAARRRDRGRGAPATAFAVMPGVAAYGARRGPPLGRAGRRGRRPARDAAAAQRLPRRRARGASTTTARSPRPGCRSWPTTTRSTPRST